MKRIELDIPAKDGEILKATWFQPQTKTRAKGTIILNSATGISRKYYTKLAIYLSQSNYHVLTYDYRGIADSRPPEIKGYSATFTDWGTLDFPGVIAFARTLKAPRLAVIGHSIGGTILGMTSASKALDTIITIGAQTAYYKDWPLPHRIQLYASWHILLPVVSGMLGYFPGKKLGSLEDIPHSLIKQWHSRRLYPEFGRQLAAGGQSLYYEQIRNKMLVVGFTDDPIGSKPALERLHRMFTQAELTYRIISPTEIGVKKIGHFGFLREQFKETIWRELLAWVEE